MSDRVMEIGEGDVIRGKEATIIADSTLAKSLLSAKYLDESGEEVAIFQTTDLFRILSGNLLGQESLFMKEGEDHADLKKFLGSYFNPNDRGERSKVFIEYSANMMNIADKMADVVAKHFDRGDRTIDVYTIFRNSILEFTATSLFGVSLKKEEIVAISEISEQMVDKENFLFQNTGCNPLAVLEKARNFLQLRDLNKEAKKSLEQILDRKLNTIDLQFEVMPLTEEKLETIRTNYKGQPKDLLEHMICNPMVDKEGNETYLSLGTILDQLLSLLMAGHITSTSINTTQTHYLEGQLKHSDPKFYAQWETEMESMEILMQALRNGASWEEIKGLHKHEASTALIQESLRMHPINTNIWRVAKKDFEINHNGKTLVFKKGEMIVVDIAKIAERFNKNLENPDQFDPRQLIETSAKVNQSLLPFAYGTHFCVGSQIAETEAKDIGGRFVYSLHKKGLELQPVKGNIVTGKDQSIKLPEKQYRTMRIAKIATDLEV